MVNAPQCFYTQGLFLCLLVRISYVHSCKPKIKIMIVKIYHYDCSSFKLLDVNVVECKTKEECELEIIKHHYQIDYDNCNTDLSEEEYIKKYKVSDLQFYENYDYEIC